MSSSVVFFLTTELIDLYQDVTEPGGIMGDSGYNIKFPEDVIIPPMGANAQSFAINLRVCVRCQIDNINSAYQLIPRSRIADHPIIMANSPGLIDKNYMGPLIVKVYNMSLTPREFKRGTSLFQIVAPNAQPSIVYIVNRDHELFSQITIRGENGFGSTGA
ncbi:deoxyuridine 5'-triphosphate nucleotidohydrolase-like [Hydra vulgaris]|uniref:Deoxyuridine 5'-triphosphate nucleotidohydrolase-like n=1 Tax=Hydra vulgaris TaxID=6087 RepID=A0ABM4BNU3_HYDVU